MSGRVPQGALSCARGSDEQRRATLAAAYRSHGPRIARRILAITGDPTSVEDLVNESFIRAHERLDRFEGRSELATWLTGIAQNVARAHVAKRSRRRRIAASLPEPALSTAGVESDEHAAARRLYRALDQLNDELRLAFVLCVLEGKTLAEASRALAVPVSTLHARKRRAEAYVRRQIEGDDELGGRR